MNEKQYLQDLKQHMDECIKELKELDQDELVDQDTFSIIKKTVEAEEILRKQHDVGVRFNVLRSQLRSLLDEVDKAIHANKPKAPPIKNDTLDAHSRFVYVCLFNAQGDKTNTWPKLLNPQALLDHSVNRPIYASKEGIEAMLRAKANKNQQGYIEVAIKKDDVLNANDPNAFKDPLGFELVRIKQGALKMENIRTFTHNTKSYTVNPDGSLVLIV